MHMYICIHIHIYGNSWAERIHLRNLKSHFCFQMSKLRPKHTSFLLKARKVANKLQYLNIQPSPQMKYMAVDQTLDCYMKKNNSSYLSMV